MYESGISGWVKCMVAGLPFVKTGILTDLIFSVLFFGGYFLAFKGFAGKKPVKNLIRFPLINIYHSQTGFIPFIRYQVFAIGCSSGQFITTVIEGIIGVTLHPDHFYIERFCQFMVLLPQVTVFLSP